MASLSSCTDSLWPGPGFLLQLHKILVFMSSSVFEHSRAYIRYSVSLFKNNNKLSRHKLCYLILWENILHLSFSSSTKSSQHCFSYLDSPTVKQQGYRGEKCVICSLLMLVWFRFMNSHVANSHFMFKGCGLNTCYVINKIWRLNIYK